MSEMRRVTAICNGTVVDHIPAGRGSAGNANAESRHWPI